jgi:hypothetical protein
MNDQRCLIRKNEVASAIFEVKCGFNTEALHFRLFMESNLDVILHELRARSFRPNEVSELRLIVHHGYLVVIFV